MHLTERHIEYADKVTATLLRERQFYRYIERDDLYQAGREGLCYAASECGDVPEQQFLSFAYLRIRGSVIDLVRKNLGRGKTKPVIVSFDERDDEGNRVRAEPVDHSQPTLDRIVNRELREEMTELFTTVFHLLSESQRRVIELYYAEGWSGKEIAAELGVTQSRVSQLHTSAIRYLQARLYRLL